MQLYPWIPLVGYLYATISNEVPNEGYPNKSCPNKSCPNKSWGFFQRHIHVPLSHCAKQRGGRAGRLPTLCPVWCWERWAREWLRAKAVGWRRRQSMLYRLDMSPLAPPPPLSITSSPCTWERGEAKCARGEATCAPLCASPALRACPTPACPTPDSPRLLSVAPSPFPPPPMVLALARRGRGGLAARAPRARTIKTARACGYHKAPTPTATPSRYLNAPTPHEYLPPAPSPPRPSSPLPLPPPA